MCYLYQEIICSDAIICLPVTRFIGNSGFIKKVSEKIFYLY